MKTLFVSLCFPWREWAYASTKNVGMDYLEQTFQSAFTLDGFLQLLDSTTFRMIMGLIVLVALISWVVYLWTSVRMAYDKEATRVARPRRFAPHAPILLPEAGIWYTGRTGHAPGLVLVEYEIPAPEDETDARGETNSQR